MPKPSIFSRDYDERMRKRKKIKRLIFWGVALLLILIFIFSGAISSITRGTTLGFNKFGEKLTTLISSRIFSKEKDEKKDKEPNPKDAIQIPKEESKLDKKSNVDNTSTGKSGSKTDTNETKEQVIKLSNGEEVTLKYTIKSNEKQYTGMLPNTINYDISPSKKNIVLIENKTQNMIYIDNNGNVKDITKKQYVSSKGTIFNKDKIIEMNKDYIWCSSPRFINEDTILYTSQLPWFNKSTAKFLWKYSISTNKHKHNLSTQGGEVGGQNVVYGNIIPEGIEVIVDGKKIVVK